MRVPQAFAPSAAGPSEPGKGTGLTDKLRQLEKAGIEENPGAKDRTVSGTGKKTQHKVAVAALERKAEKASAVKARAASHDARQLPVCSQQCAVHHSSDCIACAAGQDLLVAARGGAARARAGSAGEQDLAAEPRPPCVGGSYGGGHQGGARALLWRYRRRRAGEAGAHEEGQRRRRQGATRPTHTSPRAVHISQCNAGAGHH